MSLVSLIKSATAASAATASATAATSTTAATSSAAAASAAATPGGSAASGSGDARFDAMLAALRDGGAAPSAAAGTGAASGPAAGTTGSASSDETEDRFLKLLVAQMKNQDPLNPLDNAQVTTQLAQINTVKGIDKLNQSLQTLVERGESGSTTEAASMVGRRVLVEGDTLALDREGPARAGFELAAEASRVEVDILDRNGTVVDTRSFGRLPAGLQTFDWSGTVAGERLAAGTYSMRVNASSGTERVGATALSAVPVQAVTRGADGVSLQLGTFGSRPLDQVRGIL